MRSTRRLIPPAALAAVVALAAGCGGDDEDDAPSASTTTPAQAATAPPTDTTATAPPTTATAPSTTATAPSTTATAPSTTATVAPADDGPPASAADRRAIETVVRASLVEDDPKRSCATLSSRLKRRIFDSQARCIRVARQDAKDDDTLEIDKVAFLAVSADGRKGVARVRTSGEDGSGTGRVSVLKERGRWLVHGYEADLLRSLITGSLDSSEDDEDIEAFLTPQVRSCYEGRLQKRSDAQIQKLFYDSAGNRKGADQRLAVDLLACARQNPDAVRKQFEATFLENDDLPAAAKRCIVQGLRTRAPDSLLVQIFEDGVNDREDTAAGKRFEAIVRGVAQGCASAAGNTDRG